jgi:purine-binding chemotaxis protein CheW
MWLESCCLSSDNSQAPAAKFHVIQGYFNISKRFGLEPQEKTRDRRIVVTSIDGKEVGMIVDGVSEVLTVPQQAVEPSPAITTTVDSSFITGIAKIDQRLVILLDLAKILTVEEQASLEQIQ